MKLNANWNAEPNAPDPKVEVFGDTVVLRFVLNYHLYQQFAEEQPGTLSMAADWSFKAEPVRHTEDAT